MKHILISGGAGFIGGHLTRQALASGYRVRILDNLSPEVHGPDARFEPPDGAEFIFGDVTVRDDWERALQGIECIVHLAAETGTGQSMYEIDRYYRANVQGTALLFDLLANTQHRVGKIVLASSRSVYGEGAYICRNCDSDGKRIFPAPRPQEQLEAQDWSPRCPECRGPIVPTASREDDRLSPASIYASTKLAQEDLVRVGCHAMAIPHTILRLQNIYGEGQSLKNPYTGILSIFSNRIRLGLPLPIYEDGAESRDFVHVEDVAEVILRCLDASDKAGTTLNVGSGTPISVLEVAKMLCRHMGASIEPQITGEYRVGDIRHNFADVEKLERLTGFTPRIGIESGIARFCNWVLTMPIEEDLLERAKSELKARNLMR